MNFLNKIKQSFGSGKVKKEQTDRLQAILTEALSDGLLSEKELLYMSEVFVGSQLSVEDYTELKSNVFVRVVHSYIADRRVTDAEKTVIFTIAEQLEIPAQWVEWARQQIQYYALFHYIEQGGELPVRTPQNLILKKGETCHLSIPAALFEERVIRREYVGGSQGLSIPIIKGVRYTVGRQRGHIQSHSSIVPVSQGYFIITNKRLVFSGSKSVSSDLSKLLDMQLYSDALQFSVTSRQKPTTVKFSCPEEIELCGLIISRLINEQ
jgi:hypothetical protein